MRGFSRALLARTFAALLSLLAASPLTAPFSTCDWSDLGRDQAIDLTHLQHPQASDPEVKTTSDLNTTMFTVVVTTVDADHSSRQRVSSLPAAPERTPGRVQVLRI